MDYNLVFIPSDFNEPHREMFDTAYMRALYKRAYDMAVQGFPWAKHLPGFEEQQDNYWGQI